MLGIRPKYFRASRRVRLTLFPAGMLAALSLDVGCAKVCNDDGFAWQQDPSCLALVASNTEATTESDDTMDPSESETAPTTSGEGAAWCMDADGDGFGDPGACTDVPPGTAPPPGTVDNDDDCDDDSAKTFPGAAPNDDPEACMQDDDDDDWGDKDPTGDPEGGITPGTDCDDASGFTFPGAAPNDDPEACMKDEDEDDWGDKDPPGGPDGGVVPGTDCDDANMNAWKICGGCNDDDGDGWFSECDGYPPEFPGPDCDDSDPQTFPGAAPLDDPDACMKDADEDDWGDMTPPMKPGLEPGTDCDDDDAKTFPGAAPLDDPTACMEDGDDDDHGKAHPDKPGVQPGNDCNDDHNGVNPTDSVLITAPNTTGDISEVDVETGSLTSIAKVDVSEFDLWVPTSVAISPVDRSVYVALLQDDTLATMNFCGAGVPTHLPAAHKKSLCGLAFDADGTLYGIDGQLDQILTFKPDGSLADIKPLTFDGSSLNVGECGMTYDCHQERLMVSDTASNAIYTVDLATGTTEKVADLPAESFGAGLAYEPVSKRALTCNKKAFYSVAVDGSNAFTKLPDLQATVDDLEFAPGCD